MKTNNIMTIVTIVIVALFVAFSGTASAQNEAGVIAGVANSKGCFHAAVNNGILAVENCNGWLLKAGVEYANVSYENENGSSTTQEIKGRIGVEYQYYWFRPEVNFAMGTQMDVEGNKYSSPELQVAANFDINRHDNVRFYVAPTATYKLVRSTKNVETSEFIMHLPYEGSYFAPGAKVGCMIKLGTFAKQKTTEFGGKRYRYNKCGQHYLRIEGAANYGEVDKLKDSNVESTLKLFTWSVNLTYAIKLP